MEQVLKNAEQFDIPAQENPEIIPVIVDRITLASHQNDVAILPSLIIKNPGTEILENLELSLECDPPLVNPRTWHIDRVYPDSEMRISDKSISVSGSLLSEINERIRSELKLTLKKDDEVLCTHHHIMIGLAKNEWGGASYMPELLAAFVMPNDPGVSTILKQAGEALRSAGEQPSLNGYQSGSRQRVWQIASAIWTAVSSRRLVYVEPPASFEEHGQKIRLPSEILETGLATCLDTTVLFAAALEQAGLHPVIALTKGHCFCGVWLQPQELPSLITDECSALRKYIALKELVLFETTLAVNEPPVSFSKAINEANRQISEENEEDFIYALDIKRARRQQIAPLSIKIKSGSEVIADQKVIVGLESAPELPSFDLGLKEINETETAETRLDHWKRKLLDLTKRNRLLNLKPSKTAIKLYCSNPAVLEDKLAEGKKITVIPMTKLSDQKNERDNVLFISRTGEDFKQRFVEEALQRDEIVSDIPQAELESGLIELYRKARLDLQEGGANTLFLALGVLKWKQSENEEQIYRAPLILVPIKLERRSAASPVRITHHEDEPVFNMTLLEMLRQDFDLKIPDLTGALPKDHSGVDVPLILETVRKAVRDIPGFEVVEEVVLSTFSFAKYLMWKDLAERTDKLRESLFVRHLIDKPRDPYEYSTEFLKPEQIDEKIDHSELFMPLSADSSQIVAVHASSQEGDFILEGPPGTGKSQTIANIIAHNLALGRKVLFVSEKMAALEVVYQRLREKGLGDFCLELHSNKANKRQVLDQLGQSWRNRSADTETQWHEETKRLNQLRSELNALVKALHKPGQTGISPRSAIARAVRYNDIHRFRLDWKGGLEADKAKSKEERIVLEQIAKRLGQTYGVLDGRDIATFQNIFCSEWSNAWQGRLVFAAENVTKATTKLIVSHNAFAEKLGFTEIRPAVSKFRALSMLAKVLPFAGTHNLEFGFGTDYMEVFKAYEDALSYLEKYRAVKSELSCSYSDDNIPKVSIQELQAEWIKVSSSYLLGSINRKRFAKRMQKAFFLSAIPQPEKDLPLLSELQLIQKDIQSTSSALPNSAQWRSFDTDIEKARSTLEKARSIREAAAKFSSDIPELTALLSSIKGLCVEGRELLQPGMPLVDLMATCAQDMQDFDKAGQVFAKEAQAQDVLNDDILDIQSKMSLISELQPRINSWCKWQAACREAESKGLEALISALQLRVVEPANIEESFKTAYCTWLAERMIDERPELTKFSALEHNEKIEEFRKLDQKVCELSIDYIRAKLSGDIPHPQDTKRPEGYGILSRELQKKMRHKPVRQLVAEMGDVLTTLTPCLLMSPLSVAQFLSTDNKLFDLVVFDEASQITVWDAIGAIARGKNVIIVGDPKQMPPTNFFDRAASDGDDDDNNSDDLESILDEALASGIKLHRLTGHYRSRHESLIAFSNHRYYGGELVTYPASETKKSAVSFIRVEGTYQRGKGRTNPEEAKALVNTVVSRLNNPALNNESIGIVTFNSEQQKLIQDLLDHERRKNPDLERFFNDDCKEPVFVKNLETVQGDQRDVILLSIGYGPDVPSAKTMSMNFGPLNRKGGERRLNVAITRAASEVVVFASFDPSLIDLTRTSAQAVHDLKHYLEFAQRGPTALGEAILSVGGLNSYDSDFEEAIAEGLRHKGWTIHTQIGVSKFRIDLGVVHPDFPGKYLAGVECDGAAYHSSPSARDRDRMRHNILENLGWKLLRIWSTDYWIDPARVFENIHQRLTKMLEDDREKQIQIAQETAKANLEQNHDTLSFSEALSEEEAFNDEIESAEIDEKEEQNSLDAMSDILPKAVLEKLSARKFYEKEYLPVIKLIGLRLIDELGPITFRHLSAKIARAHGFQRTGSQIKKQVWAALAKDRDTTKAPNGEVIFWSNKLEPKDCLGFRGMILGGEKRTWQDIPYPEKLGLALTVLNLEEESAIDSLVSQLGLGRLHSSTKEELERLINDAKRYAA